MRLPVRRRRQRPSDLDRTDPAAALWWECMMCHRVRRDDKIDVVRVPITSMPDLWPVSYATVRHCTDRQRCAQAARMVISWP